MGEAVVEFPTIHAPTDPERAAVIDARSDTTLLLVVPDAGVRATRSPARSDRRCPSTGAR